MGLLGLIDQGPFDLKVHQRYQPGGDQANDRHGQGEPHSLGQAVVAARVVIHCAYPPIGPGKPRRRNSINRRYVPTAEPTSIIHTPQLGTLIFGRLSRPRQGDVMGHHHMPQHPGGQVPDLSHPGPRLGKYPH